MHHQLVLRLAPALLAWAALTGAARATPYLPAHGGDVIEVLPRRADATQTELRRLRLALNARPRDVELATALAQRYIAVGRDASDPRYLGYAQAALAPWWREAAPPSAVLLLRATLLQSTHQFPAALADLERLLAAEPSNAQAWLTRATVLTVRGDYAGATASCARLSALANELVTAACIASVGALTGRAQPSEQLLALVLQRGASAPPEQRQWALTLLAEMAAQRGDARQAELRYRGALTLNPHDAYLLGAYADFLLDQGRPADVLTLLKEHTRVDALLLRHALALRLMPGATAALAADVAALAARFSAATERGDTLHQREQARFALYLQHDAATALTLARQNWAVQKEAADMRIYLEAALQAHDAAAARPLLDWIARNHTEGATLRALVRQLNPGA
ncbi:MAG TPA: hypothetical protein VFT05_08975 [Burkholderiaceae bacterium]|nr:hypothetical protein [Burkholderiaceae bacterium]